MTTYIDDIAMIFTILMIFNMMRGLTVWHTQSAIHGTDSKRVKFDRLGTGRELL